MREKIRVGILLDSLDVCAWQYEMFRRIVESGCAEVILLVMNGGKISSADTGNRRVIHKIRGNLRDNIHMIIRKSLLAAHKTLFRERPFVPDAFSRRGLRELFPEVSAITVNPVRKQFSDYFLPEDIVAIRRYRPDVLIRAGFRVLRGEILTCARFGVWSYHHGDNCLNRGGPAGYWETMEGWPEMGTVLQVLTEDLDNGLVLARTYSCVNRFFVEQNRNACYWKAMALLPRKLRELYTLGAEAFFRKVSEDNGHPCFYASRLYRDPTNRELAGLLVGNYRQKIKNKFRNTFYFEQWELMYRLGADISSSFWRFKRMVPPKDRFWADPHVLYRDGNYYIFIEELPFKSNKGHIAVIRMDKNGRYDQPVTVLEKPYHLSYPFIFEWEGECYMVPESAQNRSVDLYRCVSFPFKWEFRARLMDNVAAFDTTLFRYQDKWWLFTNLVETVGAPSYDELFVFHSEDLFSGNWEPHDGNPVISDAKRARPAGGIFVHNGKIYRPSQFCYGRYGRGINISQIKLLNENEYREEMVSRIEPNWSKKILATHTLNHDNGLTVIDAQNLRRK